jgi:hypothetical protein
LQLTRRAADYQWQPDGGIMFRGTKLKYAKSVQLIDYALRMNIQPIAGHAAAAFVLGSIIGPRLAFAGGLDQATQAATTFKIWLYSFIGIVAVCILLWKGTECMADRAHWSEFGVLSAKVAAVGSVVGVLAPYLWNMFS